MASDTDSGRNDESDLALTWSGRWTLSYRILAVNILTIVLIGTLLVIAIPVLLIVFGIIATMKANAGEYYTYPIAIRFVQ